MQQLVRELAALAATVSYGETSNATMPTVTLRPFRFAHLARLLRRCPAAYSPRRLLLNGRHERNLYHTRRSRRLRRQFTSVIATTMPRRSSHPFDALVDRFAQFFAERISAALAVPAARGGNRNGVASKLRGRKLDMRCHYPGCKNRSKGPRFRFLCEEHLKLPKKEQDAALEKWAEKNA